ncbi:oxidoreductase FAD/NAD(P)-binding protein [Caballeronia udeis]|uniref:Oxidoreductase FAD/NAD(P)-binding protein n=2 Tax=Burkholderiales TaxID=80840 RepID=A0A158GKA8_9BURK|nr:Phenol hydroxylase P5 protein [Paraburkholderia aspalathi]SAL32049.1 oxidoreductase FAD/NAD(P)-binding protein [Caballeronia udeis]
MTIEPLSHTVEVAAGQTLLEAALRSGVYIPHACLHGLCGTCKVQVVEGEVDLGDASPFALMDVERDEGKCLACVAIAQSDLVIEADIDDEPDAESHPMQDFIGTVRKVSDLTPTAKGVWIELDGSGIDFQAGQYVNLHLPGVAEPRAFSIATAPSSKRLIELNIRRVPGGKATEYVHTRLKEGEKIRLSGPYGRFFVRRSSPESFLFLAGGTGLSSPKSMILDLLEKGETRSIKLFYGARNVRELYDDDLFRDLAIRYPNLTYVPTLSEPDPDVEWLGERGYVHEVATRHFDGDFRHFKAYMCGPPVMIDACISALIRGRLFERDMYMEKFISAADLTTSARKSPLFKAI